MALTLDEIQSTTNDFWLPKAVDQYYHSNVLIYRMLRQGAKVSGGEKIRQVLHYGAPKGGAFGPNSRFDTTRRDDLNAARFAWALYYEPVTYDIFDKIQNAGTSAEIDIVMTKLNMSQKAIRDSMGNAIYGTGVAVDDERPITGLKAMINSTSSTTYGTISEDDMAEWAPGAVTTTTESLTLPVMRTLTNACEAGDGAEADPTIYITTKALHSVFKGLLQPQQRYSDDKLASAGFKNIQFEGIPVVKDGKCDDGFMYALNENYMGFKTHNDFMFKHTDWMRPTDEYKFTMQVMWVGNMICKRRDAHGYHSNLS